MMNHKIFIIILLCIITESAKAVDNKQYVPIADSYSIDIAFFPNDNYDGVIYEPMLSISHSNLLICTIIYDYSLDNGCYISLISSDNVSKSIEIPHRVISQNDTLHYSIHIDNNKHNCLIYGHLDTLRFDYSSPNEMSYKQLTITSFNNSDIIDLCQFEIKENAIDDSNHSLFLWIMVIVLFDILVFAYMHLQNKKRDKAKKDVKEQNTSIIHKEILKNESDAHSGIYLFGDFKAYSKDGIDISNLFSPILKELFFLLICNSNGKGISTESLKSILWYDKSEQSANNNRRVYFNKVKTIISQIGNCEIVGDNGYWKIEMPDITIDYLQFIKLLSKGIVSTSDIKQLLDIVKKGSFLSHYDYEWLDSVKSDISDSIITILSNYVTGLNIKDETDLVIDICDALFIFDTLSEVGLEYKCKAYKEYGKHTLAKQLYSNYAKEYLTLYGEEYSKSFLEIIENSH